MERGNLKIVILGFNNPTVIEETFQRFFELTDLEGLDYELIFVDCCYPLPDRQQNKNIYKAQCFKYKATYLPLIRNFGQDGNYNKIFFSPWINDDTLLLFFDPDNKPQNKSYLKTLIKLQVETNAGYITLHRHHPHFDMRRAQGNLQVSERGIKYRPLRNTGGWPMALWSGEFIKKMRPLHQSHSFYGGTENNIWDALQRTNCPGLMLEDEEDLMISTNNDKEYIIWKAIVINSTEHLDFEEWLQKYNLTYHLRQA